MKIGILLDLPTSTYSHNLINEEKILKKQFYSVGCMLKQTFEIYIPLWDSLNVGTIATFNLHLVGTLKNNCYQTDLLFLVYPVCDPLVPMAIKSVSCWSGYSFLGLIKTDQLVTIYIMNVMS